MMTRAPQWFDTHVHLDACASPRASLESARHTGVASLVIPGVHPAGWEGLLHLAETHEGVYAAPGVHPSAARDWSPQHAENLAALLEHPKVVALGEIGLDRLLDKADLEVQKKALRQQLRLAVKAGKPVLVHCRKAYGELLAILIEEGAEQIGGILHAYGGSLETARTAIGLNFAIAFGGSLTWPGARRAPEVLQGIPAETIVLESDAPDMAPHPHRGETNRPEWLPLVGAEVARLRGLDLMQVADMTTRNARRVLHLNGPAQPS